MKLKQLMSGEAEVLERKVLTTNVKEDETPG